MIRKAKIIDGKKNNSKVDISSTVVIKIDGEEETYTIVGATESDPLSGKISSESPIAQALLGHEVGDKVEFPTPDGKGECQIMKIQ